LGGKIQHPQTTFHAETIVCIVYYIMICKIL
jgi:hypothetical protein